MFHHNSNEHVSLKTAFHWSLLCMLSGSVNAGGFLACQRFVSHVTGFATLFGIDAAAGRWDGAIGILSVPAFYLMGSFFAAHLVDPRINRGHRPHYDVVMALVTLFLVLTALCGHFNAFGGFGDTIKLKQDYFFLAFLCTASGLQNSAITIASGFTVRTSHMTGTTTDLGIALARFFALGAAPQDHRRDMEAMLLKAGAIASFALGGFLGAYLFMRIHYLGFLLPAGIAFFATFIARKNREIITQTHLRRVKGEPAR